MRVHARSFFALPLLFPCSSLTCERPMSPADLADDAEECSKLHYFAEKRQLPHSRVMQFMFMQQSCERIPSFFPCSLLTCERPFLPQIPLITQRNAASCIISQTKDSCHIVETMQFMFIQQSCEETCLLIPCSFLAHSLFIPRSSLTCERPILSQITQIIADKTQTTPKHHKHQPVFLCEIMQLAAFLLCVISVICGRITRKRTQAISTEETPIYLPQISLMTQTKPKNHTNYKMQFSAI